MIWFPIILELDRRPIWDNNAGFGLVSALFPGSIYIRAICLHHIYIYIRVDK